MSRCIHVVLADDHEIVLMGARTALSSEPEVEVVGEARDGAQARELVERLRPEVLVLDLQMPKIAGMKVLGYVARRCSRTAVVVYSGFGSEACIATAMNLGARGFVLKEARVSELVTAVRAAAAGRCYLAPPIERAAVEAQGWRPGQSCQDLYQSLSPRERQVLPLLATGLSTAQTAARLRIGPRTVETHRAHLLQKLRLRNTGELIRYVFQHGLMPSPWERGGRS
jgi:two-component system response regulator NreC